jgi:hypothetical protein
VIEPQAIASVSAQYKKHGWTLRRLLLTDTAQASGLDLEPAVQVSQSDLNAAWFTRSSTPGTEAWELRTLEGTPFALLEVIPDGTPADDLETALKGVEQRMAAARKK